MHFVRNINTILYSATEIQQYLKQASLVGTRLRLSEFSPMFPTVLFFMHLVTELIRVSFY